MVKTVRHRICFWTSHHQDSLQAEEGIGRQPEPQDKAGEEFEGVPPDPANAQPEKAKVEVPSPARQG